MSDLEIKVEQSLETLHKALTNLEPAIVHVQSVMEASKAAKSIVHENISFLKNQKEINEEHKVKLVLSLNEGVANISKKSYEVLDGVKNSTKDIITLDNSINKYLESIIKIDFPTRLTSIESDISSVSSALNNMQGTVNTIQNEIVRLERENKAVSDTLKKQFEKGNENLSQKLDFINKENKTLKTLLIVTAIISLSAVITNFI